MNNKKTDASCCKKIILQRQSAYWVCIKQLALTILWGSRAMYRTVITTINQSIKTHYLAVLSS